MMKNKLYIAIVILSCLVVSCTKYDDSAINSRIDQLQLVVAELEERCQAMNNNILSLQQVVNAVRNHEGIVDVRDLADGTGYSITFSSGRTITLHNGNNGKDGKDGEDGRTPAVSVRMDSDGVYY